MPRALRATLVSAALVGLCNLSHRSIAQEPDTPYAGAQVRQWAVESQSGHRAAVLAAVEANLASNQPDPFAPSVWCDLEDSVGNLKPAWEGLKDDKVRAGLGVLPQLKLDLAWSRPVDAAKVASERKEHLTPFELQAYAVIQHSIGDDEGAAASMIEAMRASPKLFVLTETLNGWMSNRAFRAIMVAAMQSGRIPADSLFAKAESHRSASGTMDDYGWRQVLLQWPGADQDARIQSNLAAMAYNAHRFKQAASLYEKAIAIYPFGEYPHVWLSASFMRDGQWDQAAQVTNHAAELFTTGDSDLLIRKILLRAEAEIDAGENGRLRGTLCLTEAPDPVPPACSAFPDALRLDPTYLHDVAALERGAGRPALAAAALKKLSDPTPDDLLQVIDDRVSANDIDGAWDSLQRIDMVAADRVLRYFRAASVVQRIAKHAADELKWDDLGLKQYPNDIFLHRERALALAGMGRNAEAVEEWNRVFTMEDPVAWTLTSYRQALVALDAKSANAKMAALLNQLPTVEAVWVDAAAQLDKDQYDSLCALWERAASLNPTDYWPWSHLQDSYNDHEEWTKTRDALARGTLAVAKGSHSARENLDYYFLWQLQMESQAGGPSPKGPSGDDVSKGQNLLAQHDADQDDLSLILRYKAKLMDESGNQKEAARLTLQGFQVDPDNWTLGFSAITVFYDSLGVGRVMHAAYHYLDRQPYDGIRLKNLTQIAVMWHVNPVEALRLLELTKQRAPSSYSAEYYGMAEGNLGDYVSLYNTNYTGKTIDVGAASDRYISWFDNARKHVQAPTNAVKQLDFERDEVTLRLPSGQIVTRGWDRYGGKATLIQIGGVYIRLTYDEAENLTRIEQSNKHFVQLNYDEGDRIQKMVNSFGDVLTFKYKDNNKPIEIGLEGVGVITVTYKPDGEIDKVDSTAGRTIALKITSAFQDLKDLLHEVQSATNDITSVPDIPLEDPQLQKLESAYQAAQVRTAYGGNASREPAGAEPATPGATEAGLQLGQYLVAHSEDSLSNTEEAERVLYGMLDSAEASHSLAAVAVGARVMELLQRLYKHERPDGIDAEDWRRWSTAREWLSHHDVSSPEAHRVNAFLEKEPVRILPPDEWEPKSYLHSPGYWRGFNDPRLKNTQAVLVRANNDYVVGTTKGILVFRQAHWTAYAYDPIARRFSATADPSGPSSDVHALAEDAGGNLWVGTASGLICVKGDYDATVSRWSSAADGLPSGYIQAIAASGNQVYVAAQGGLAYFSGDGNFRSLPEFSNTTIASLDACFLGRAAARDSVSTAPAEGQPVLATTDQDVWLLRSGKAAKLHPGGARSAVLDGNVVYEWTDDGLKYFNLKDDGSAGDISSVPDQERILKSKQVFGLAILPIEEEDHAIAVLTDQGMSLYRDSHFEQQQVELLTYRSAGVKALASRGLRTLVLTSEGLFSVERGQAIQDTEGEVFDLLSVPDEGVTFVARGNSLEAVSQLHPEKGASTVDTISATHLVLDPAGRLVANDGTTIVRYEKGSTHSTELFQAVPANPDAPNHADFPQSIVRSILAASDGTIWVASGGELFRWKEGMDHPEEYSVYVDPVKFPAPTDMVSRVYETLDHRIIVICSDERHLFYRGIKLSGGVLQWQVDHLIRVPLQEDSKSWFLTGYTPINATTAILGTTRGFLLESNNSLSSFEDSKDASYAKMSAEAKLIALGTRGTKLGDNTWLFGSAGGVLAYSGGTWFYPDRLNRMLPEDYRFAGTYGVRDVHAVASDPAGHIYVGNDRGLLIYDSGGGDSRSFLITDQNLELAIQSTEDEKLRAEQRILAASNTADGNAVRSIQRTKLEIDRLQARSSADLLIDEPAQPSVNSAPIPDAASGGLSHLQMNGKGSVQPTLDQLAAAKQKYLTQLIQLEQRNPHLHDALGEPQPLYIASLKQRLGAGQVLLQYIPAGDSLAISVVTHDSARLVMVDGVSQSELDLRSQRAWYTMARGRVTESPKNVLDALQAQATPLQDDLTWLYDKLLRPVEGDIDGSSSVLIVPNGRLTYVPFGALIRSTGDKPEYAIQRYTFGYMPSLYLFDKLAQGAARSSNTPVVLADPDGSLPNADKEAASIVAIMKGSVPAKVGVDANLPNLMQLAPQAGILHLATHAILNPDHPEASYLLLAKDRFSVVDAMTLPLTANDLVVLSACETGVGGQGMEYVHLAFAFSYAGSPTIVASLWQVPDQSTSEIMVEFYKGIEGGDSNFVALAKAQRTMLAKYPQPRDWAGFLAMGRP